MNDDQFLEQIGMISTWESLEVVRHLRSALSEFSSVPGIVPQSILPDHRTESDLGIHHLDSLDLVDLATSIETDTLRWQAEELRQVAELNSRDGTVRELALLVLDFSRRSKPEFDRTK